MSVGRQTPTEKANMLLILNLDKGSYISTLSENESEMSLTHSSTEGTQVSGSWLLSDHEQPLLKSGLTLAFAGLLMLLVRALYLLVIGEGTPLTVVHLDLRFPYLPTLTDQHRDLKFDSTREIAFKSARSFGVLTGRQEIGNHSTVRKSSTPQADEVEDSNRDLPELPYSSLGNVKYEDTKGTGWVQFPYQDVNETEQLMLPIRKNGTLPCHNVRTQNAQVLGFPNPAIQEGQKRIQLLAGLVYELTIVSMGNDGQPRCAGGDYYETDLSGPRWKSRPPVLDCNNGTYSIKLQMDPRFAGEYNFTVILLFANFHGLHHHPQKFARIEEVARYAIDFTVPESFLISPQEARSESSAAAVRHHELPMCAIQDFKKKYWSGRWTREKANEDCEFGIDGRWQCVDTNMQCQKPWCQGRVGSLESNGWVYSAHCGFKIFEKEEAWQCLDGKWLFFWGDSNHDDTIRNLLNFVLGFDMQIPQIGRRMDTTYFSPPQNQSSVRLTSVFNGHSNVSMNHEGLFSLHDPQFAEQIRSFFTGETAPDIMIMNSGLHDGVYWKYVESFLEDGVEFAVNFWADVWNNMRVRRPDVVYRTTVSPAGRARTMPLNPHKMELFNHLLVDRLVKMNLERFHIIDGFDYTYPWHYDHRTSDGVHYGRPPKNSRWVDGNIGHAYFVDLMLVHMLLNVICLPP